ncbi:MAG: hypothetical protein KA124_04905, partial [Luteimonas sp.]|nr:hypothetical protein [Luteimonas sp.]
MNALIARWRVAVDRLRPLVRCFFAFALVGLAAPAAAESLVSAQQQTFPAMPGTTEAPTLAVWGDRLV